ncbi:hypothetical protein SAMN05443633_107165 [Chryseobacterium arachidis]|uniref:Uncharacterized protein n=2 Tax=Chryseobacterium arachidis TaxID=1416778 RepID=A0A1M5F4U7_9FLAO|nr:hypothetical protein SAMN05443633_107165 [Chryseobacterium arachidis]
MKAHEELKSIFIHRKNIDVAMEIFGFTGQRTTIIDELTEEEVLKLLKIHCPIPSELESECEQLKSEIFRKKLISNILVLAEKTGIKKANDFYDFNKWMIQSGKFKKHLNAHSVEELKEVYKQLKAVEKSNTKSAGKPFTKAWWYKEGKRKALN